MFFVFLFNPKTQTLQPFVTQRWAEMRESRSLTWLYALTSNKSELKFYFFFYKLSQPHLDAALRAGLRALAYMFTSVITPW